MNKTNVSLKELESMLIDAKITNKEKTALLLRNKELRKEIVSAIRKKN